MSTENKQTEAKTVTAPSVGFGAFFDRCVRRKLRNDGRLSIRCRIGLWSVESADLDAAEREARHYWIQYYQDGEYAALLSNADDDRRPDLRKP